MKKILKSIKGNDFEFEVCNLAEEIISVLQAGYIITPEGDFIPVNDDEYHKDVFTNYLNKYLENNPLASYSSNEALNALIKINHIVYYGIKPQVINNVYENRGGNTGGFGLLILPKNYLDVMTNEQRKSTKVLLDSNKSIFGNSEKILLEIYEQKEENKLNKKEFINFLESYIENDEIKPKL